MEEKRISKYQKPFRIVFAVYGVLILTCLVLMIIASIDEPWWPMIWMFGGIVVLQAIVPVFAATFGVKHLLQLREGTRAFADKTFDRFVSVFAIVLAVLALVSMAGQYLLDPTYPWSATELFGKLQKLSFAFGVLSLLPLAAGGIVKRIASDKKWIRVCATCLTVCITLAVLLVPTRAGSYNDGGGIPEQGSKIYEAVLYEIVVWNRTHEFDGTPLAITEQQHTRIYFFPFDCYSYDGKWEMKH